MNGIPIGSDWDAWRPVGCGVEALADVVGVHSRAGLEELLEAIVTRGGYDPEVGWKHRQLIEVGRRYGWCGRATSGVSAQDLCPGKTWMLSVREPDFCAGTHLISARSTRNGGLMIFWPGRHPSYGERFTCSADWLTRRMTGRGIRWVDAR